MAAEQLKHAVSGSVAAITATASATSAPTSGTDGFDTNYYSAVRAIVLYAGTVTAAAIRIWFRDRATGIWYRGPETGDTLGPPALEAVTADGGEARDFTTGRNQEIFFQLTTATGGGDIAVRIQPLDLGQRR